MNIRVELLARIEKVSRMSLLLGMRAYRKATGITSKKDMSLQGNSVH